jgi:twitching motility protein PilT
MASLVDRYNASYRGFVVTVEDPISFLHRDGTATIVQRGVGSDVPSIAEGVLSATRQLADLIAVGDVPDRATAEVVLRAAEEVAIVLACVPAPDVNLAASWILRHYANDADMDAKGRIKRLLRGVACVPDEGASKYVSRRSTAWKQAS